MRSSGRIACNLDGRDIAAPVRHRRAIDKIAFRVVPATAPYRRTAHPAFPSSFDQVVAKAS